MQRQRGELVPIGEVVADLDGPVKKLRDAPGGSPLHPLRSSEPACRGQRSGPRSRLHGADAGAVQPAAQQPRQPDSVCPSQRPLHALHDGRRRL